VDEQVGVKALALRSTARLQLTRKVQSEETGKIETKNGRAS